MSNFGPFPFRAARDRVEPAGVEFYDYLHDRATAITETDTQARALRERLWIFLQQYDHLRDEHHQAGEVGEPSIDAYAERWRTNQRTAHRAFAEFFVAFPSERDPARVVSELWRGIGEQAPFGSLMALGTVKIVQVCVRCRRDAPAPTSKEWLSAWHWAGDGVVCAQCVTGPEAEDMVRRFERHALGSDFFEGGER